MNSNRLLKKPAMALLAVGQIVGADIQFIGQQCCHGISNSLPGNAASSVRN
jgi:hypothetical protein